MSIHADESCEVATAELLYVIFLILLSCLYLKLKSSISVFSCDPSNPSMASLTAAASLIALATTLSGCGSDPKAACTSWTGDHAPAGALGIVTVVTPAQATADACSAFCDACDGCNVYNGEDTADAAALGTCVLWGAACILHPDSGCPAPAPASLVGSLKVIENELETMSSVLV